MPKDLTKDDSDNEDSYQCLSGTTTTSSKNKNQNLADNRNKKEQKRNKDSAEINVSSVAYYPVDLSREAKLSTITQTNDGQQIDVNDGEKECVSSDAAVVGVQPFTENVQTSSTCCIIM